MTLSWPITCSNQGNNQVELQSKIKTINLVRMEYNNYMYYYNSKNLLFKDRMYFLPSSTSCSRHYPLSFISNVHAPITGILVRQVPYNLSFPTNQAKN